MSKRSPVETIKVHPLFRKKLKVRAAEEGITVIDLTKRLANVENEIDGVDKKKSREWKFGF